MNMTITDELQATITTSIADEKARHA